MTAGPPATKHQAPSTKHPLWALTDGSAGMQSQVEGLLEAVGLPYEIKTCRLRAPFTWLPLGNPLAHLTPESDALTPPWPDAVVTSGRRSVPLALAINRASGGRTRLIHLTDPRRHRARFDLIVAMAHDGVSGPNILSTRFALHRITPARLASAAEAWKPRLSPLPRPWTSALIGGSTNKYTLTPAAAQQLIAQLQAVQKETGGSLLITASRRTGEGNRAALRAAFANQPQVYFYEGAGDNPYVGFLSLADHLLVTDDSVNMLSEALATGTPVHVLHLPGHTETKPARFAQALIKDGLARAFTLPLLPYKYTPPDEMSAVAARAREVLS